MPVFLLGHAADPVLRLRPPLVPGRGAPGPDRGRDPRRSPGLVLPVFTLAAITIASFSRYMRSSMMEAMTEDYVRTARAKGAGPRRVLYRHALRNALIPIITLLGPVHPGHRRAGRSSPRPCSTSRAWACSTYQARHQHRHPAAPRDHVRRHPGHRRRLAARRHPLRRRRPEDPLCQVTDDRDPSGSPWSSHAAVERRRSRVGHPAQHGRSCRLGPPRRGRRPAGGEAASTGQHVPSDRVGVRREQAGRRRARSSSSSWCCSASWARSSTTPTRPTPRTALLNSTQNARPGDGPPARAPTSSGFDILGRLMFGGKNSLIVGLRRRRRGHRCSACSTGPCRLLRRLGRRAHDADRRHPAVDPACCSCSSSWP